MSIRQPITQPASIDTRPVVDSSVSPIVIGTSDKFFVIQRTKTDTPTERKERGSTGFLLIASSSLLEAHTAHHKHSIERSSNRWVVFRKQAGSRGACG